MSFYNRYVRVCREKGVLPSSQKTAETIGVTRATISFWGRKNTVPSGETVASIADMLHVSTDYLLGRTDDPTDYSAKAAPGLTWQDDDPVPADPASEETSGKPEGFRQPEAVPSRRGDADFLELLHKLNKFDQIRVEGIIQGMLLHEKYR